MAHQVDRHTVTKWLRDHGFRKLPGNAKGYDRYQLDGTTGTVSLRDHGPTDLRKCHVSVIIRTLTQMGFDSATTRAELRTKHWPKPELQQEGEG
jgi:hypothetical protein